MGIPDLVRAILAGDLLTARQWVADARRARLQWAHVARPDGLNERELAVAAAMVELLAARTGATPPSWTALVGPLQDPLVLDPGLEEMPRSFAHAKIHAPESLRSRNLVALPDFLDVA